jgi:hypothetical protein
VILPGLNGVAFQQVTNKLTTPGASVATILEADGADGDDDMMDIDVYERICSQFHTEKGCTLVDDVDDRCDKDHPYALKFNFPCPYEFHGIDCPFGKEGCKYVHEYIISQPEQQQTNHNTASQVSGERAFAPLQVQIHAFLNQNKITQADAQFFRLAENGEAKDSRNASNVCNKFTNSKCTNQLCTRIHLGNGNQAPPAPVSQQQNKPQGDGQSAQRPHACSHFANKGSCKFRNGCRDSHDPQVTYNALGRYPPGYNASRDTRMVDAASNGDNPHTRPQGNQSQACKWEANGRQCTNNECNFVHTNRQSKSYRPNQQQPNHGGGESGQGNQTYNANVHGQPRFQNDQRIANWVDRQQQIICRKCQQPGHMQKDCPQNNTNGGNNGGSNRRQPGSCFTCGGMGHRQNQCPINASSGGGGNPNAGGSRNPNTDGSRNLSNGGGRRGGRGRNS